MTSYAWDAPAVCTGCDRVLTLAAFVAGPVTGVWVDGYDPSGALTLKGTCDECRQRQRVLETLSWDGSR
jgi:hypothetical protein